MKTPLAWLNLIHNRMRTSAAVGGVAFSVLLIFMQLGFLGSVESTASLIFDALDFDLVIRSSRYLQLAETRTFPQDRLHQVASAPGVLRVTPFYVGQNQWRNPDTGSKRRILTMGLKPADPVFKVRELQVKAGLLTDPEFGLIDRKSRRDFGPRDGSQFGDADVGTETEVANQRVEIVGHFALGAGFVADGAIVLNERGFCRIQPGRTPEDVSLGLVKLEVGVSPDAAAARLQSILPSDVRVFTRTGVADFERRFWYREMSIGILFQVGVVVAMVVGTAIVYQVLSSDVTNHLAEYATLKAVGYGNGYLVKVILQQAIALGLMGFLPGMLLAEVVYRITTYVANVPVVMNVGRVVFVLAISLGMCAVSGLGALRKVRSADPADLF